MVRVRFITAAFDEEYAERPFTKFLKPGTHSGIPSISLRLSGAYRDQIRPQEGSRRERDQGKCPVSM